MKMYWIYILSLSLLPACGNKDEECHRTIIFINKTSQNLFVVPNSSYPDTMTYQFEPNPLLDPTYKKVQSFETNSKALSSRSSDCIEDVFKFSIPNDTLMIYIFKAEVLETTPWDTVIKYNLIDKRLDLSLGELVKLNWKIYYP